MKQHMKLWMALAGSIALAISGCKKSFFNRPPEDNLTVDNFYQTDAQVIASTNDLYGAPWFGYNTKVGWAITEIAGGNGRSYSSDVTNFGNYSVTPDNFELTNAWNSLYTVVAQANALINTLPVKAPSTVTPSVIANALGEAHLMRALAYFHLVRIYGNVPIVTNSADLITKYQLNTNPVADVYKFMVIDLKFAEANCTPMIRSGNSTAQGHVSSGSASALLAKVYLYMQDYTDARAEAEKVINSGEFKLYGVGVAGKTFSDLFLTANNNNEESVIALQWAPGSYGLGNATQASLAYSGVITGTGDGYGVLAPSFDLQDMYDTIHDQRAKATIMWPGDYYPQIDQASGGYTLPASASSQGTFAQIKKYVIGTPADNGGVGAAQATGNNTYMMRYAEVYLIEAEAVMAGAMTSSDPAALSAINTVRQRAGLTPLTVINRGYYVPNPNLGLYGSPPNAAAPTTLYRDDIIDERRRELAIENDFWYDLGRVDGFNVTTHPIGKIMIAQQDRGTGTESGTTITRYANGYLPITDAQFIFPYPSTEVSSDPNLTAAPVPYKF
jgi:starch-binding outer membrane protein, SusD/RagB family